MAETKERLIQELSETQKITKMVDVEAGIKAPLPREIMTWMEKVEKSSTPTQTITDTNGQPLLTPTAPINPKIILPITKGDFVAGFKKTIGDAGRWLSTFILRLIKIKKGEVTFKTEE